MQHARGHSVSPTISLALAFVSAGLLARSADAQTSGSAPREVAAPLAVAGPIADEAGARWAARRALERCAVDLELDAATIHARAATRVADLWAVEHEQRLGGLPVVGSRVDVQVGVDGVLRSARAQGLHRSAASSGFAIDADSARARAIEALGRESLSGGPARAVLQPVARSGSTALRAAWELVLDDPTLVDGGWRIAIDAADGAVLAQESLVTCAVSGTVRGRGMASGPATSALPTTSTLANLMVLGSDSAALNAYLTLNACGDSQAVISDDGLRVAYVSDCDGDPELFTISSSGAGATQLTFNTSVERSPAISANGSKIAFVSEVDGDAEIFVINSDGTGLLQITTNSATDQEPTLSGDGALVVWSSDVDGDFEIFRSSTATPAPLALTANGARDESPALSLGGARIAWVSDGDGDAEILVMNSDGTGVLQLTVNSVPDGAPSIRGDGGLIAFESQLAKAIAFGAGDTSATATGGRAAAGPGPVPPAPDWDLFTIASDGSGLTRITSSHADERAPSLASGGSLVAFQTDEGGDHEIQVYSPASGTLFDVTSNALEDTAPSLSGSGLRGVWTALDGDLEVAAWNTSAPGAFLGAFTSATGAYTLPFADGASPSVTARLDGRYVRVIDEHPSQSNLRVNASATAPSAGNDLLFHPSGTDELRTAQVTAYDHSDAAHDGLAAILTRPPLALPLPLPIDAPLKVRVNIPLAIANAFYNSLRKDTSFFIGRGAGRPNTAYDTLLQHEYGHYLDDQFGGIGSGGACEAAGALGEGAADAMAMFLSASPVIGADWKGAGRDLRNYTLPVVAPVPDPAFGRSKGRQYDGLDCRPMNGRPEIHDHGEAFAGFAWDLRSSVGAVTAENLILGALAANPPDMQGAVATVFGLAAGAGFGGSGNPATSPLYDAICAAAAAHGFDCFPRPDFSTYGCMFALCGPQPQHRTTSAEWLGTIVDFESGCEPPPNSDDDGVIFPVHVTSGTMAPLTITMRVNPALLGSGRYTSVVAAASAKRKLYLNAWLLIDNLAGGVSVHKVIGTGTPTGTLAYNPDTWGGASSRTEVFSALIPGVASQRIGFLRVRLDYGEDSSWDPANCLSSPMLAGPCGPARYGEVEEVQVVVIPAGP